MHILYHSPTITALTCLTSLKISDNIHASNPYQPANINYDLQINEINLIFSAVCALGPTIILQHQHY